MISFRPTLPLIVLALTLSCRDEAPQPPTVELRTVTTSAAIGSVAEFVAVWNRAYLEPDRAYSGSIGSANVAFTAMNDSVLYAIVPAGAPVGQADVAVDLGYERGVGIITVLPAPVIADPAQVITEVLDAGTTRVETPRPLLYGATWSKDSTVVSDIMKESATAFAQLTESQTVELARLVASLGVDQAMLAVSAQDCADRMTGLAEDVEKTGRGMFASRLFAGALRSAAKGVMVSKFINNVMTYVDVSVICNMEDGFIFRGEASDDGLGTELSVTTSTRTFRDIDEGPIAETFLKAKRNLELLYERGEEMLASARAKLSPPPDVTLKWLANGLPVEGERVSLLTTTVQAEDGTTVSLKGELRNGKFFIRAMSQLKRRLLSTLRMKVRREGYPDQETTYPVYIQPVCMEDNILLPGCVDRVVVTPSPLDLPLESSSQLKAVALDADGRELRRTFWWTTDEDSKIHVTRESGVVLATGSSETPVKVSAFAGLGTNAKEGFTMITITNKDSTEIYKKAVEGKWLVTLVATPTSGGYMMVRPDGKGAYLGGSAADCNTRHGGQIVGNTCEYPIAWELWREGNKYYFYEVGNWHPAYNEDEPEALSWPIGTHYTYFGTTKSRKYAKQP